MEFYLFSLDQSKGIALPVKEIRAIIEKKQTVKIPFSEKISEDYAIVYQNEIFFILPGSFLNIDTPHFSIVVLTGNNLAIPVGGVEKRMKISKFEKKSKKVIHYGKRKYTIIFAEEILKKVEREYEEKGFNRR